MSFDFYIDFLYFLIYSFIGWCCEVVFCSVPAKKFINRGFLNGPICPIYGCGALIVILCLTPWKSNALLVFVIGVIMTSVLEYVTSYVMEILFHTSWWDYKDKKFNINGRVCLENSLLFGGLSVLVIYVLHAFISHVVNSIQYELIQGVSTVLLVLLTADITTTVQTVVDLNAKLRKLKELTLEMKEKLGDKAFSPGQKVMDSITAIRENIDNMEITKDVYSRIERLLKEFNSTIRSYRFTQRRLIKAFPKLKSKSFQEQLLHVKNEVNNRRTKKDKELIQK